MRLLICAGGTGGGVYPALAVLQAGNDNEQDEVLWVGSDDGMERELVERAGVRFEGIPSAGLHGVNILTIPGRILKLLKGYAASSRILKEYKPDVLFFTGGYVGFPMAAAGRKIPSALFVPDIEPGMALNALSKKASLITLVCDDSRQYFTAPARYEITGYPTRKDLTGFTREAALEHFGLTGERPLLFVFGGSKGARSINQALTENLDELLTFCDIIHVTGKANWEEHPEERAGYRVYPYLHEDMGAAFAAADLVICRSGASTLGELPLFGKPAILVPYPYAWRYQKMNADYLTGKNAALMIEDGNLASEMTKTVRGLFEDRKKLEAMRVSMTSLSKPDAAKEIWDLLKGLVK